MEIGQAIDYVVEYNELHKIGKSDKGKGKEKEEPIRRQATQADWDAFWG